MNTLWERNVRIAGCIMIVRLEPELGEALQDIADTKRLPIDSLVIDIDRDRGDQDLAVAIRSYIMAYYREQTRSALEAARRGNRAIDHVLQKHHSRRDPETLARPIVEELREAEYDVTP